MKKFLTFLLSIFIILIISCEIGLGSSVDTEAPVIEVSLPPADAVIRDSFTLSGIWTDDGSIAEVTVSLTRLDSGDTFNFEGEADTDDSVSDGGVWSAFIDPLANGIKDGTYEALVAITDNGGHTTTMARTFTIDNTPPVMILQKPSTVVSESDTANRFDTFGQIFSIVGQASDDNLIDKINVSVYSSPDCSEASFLKTITLDNVPPTIDLEVAIFEEGVNNDYSEIYGYTTVSGYVQRYFKLEVYDTAKKYNSDGTIDATGNKQDSYYLYKDISDLITEYRATGLYKILSGNRAAESGNALQRLADDKREVGKFQLNPDNSPTFVVSARSALTYDKTLADMDYQLTSGNSFIEVQIDPGLDSTPILEDTIGLYLKECNEYGEPVESSPKVWLIRPVAPATEEFVSDVSEAAHSEENATITISGDSYKFKTTNVISSLNYEGLEVGHYYRIYVTGKDKNDMTIVPYSNSIYAFQLASSGNIIELNAKSDQLYITSNQSANATEKNSLKITLDYQGGSAPYTFWEDGVDITSTLSVGEKHTEIIRSREVIATWPVTKTLLTYQLKGTGESVSTVKNVSIIIDNTVPVINNSSIKVGTDNYNASQYYDNLYLKITGTCTEENLDTVYYYVQWPNRGAGQEGYAVPANLSAVHDGEISKFNGNEFVFPAVEFKDNSANPTDGTVIPNKLYIQAMDKSGNLSERKEYTINVDTTAPELSACWSKVGENGSYNNATETIYVKAGANLFVYGKYKDPESGVNEISLPEGFPTGAEIRYSNTEISAPGTPSGYGNVNTVTDWQPYNAANKNLIKSWRLQYTPQESGAVSITGSSVAGRSATVNAFTLVLDTDAPEINSINLVSVVGDTASNAYRDSDEQSVNYYVNPTGKSFKITGNVTDNFGLQKISLYKDYYEPTTPDVNLLKSGLCNSAVAAIDSILTGSATSAYTFTMSDAGWGTESVLKLVVTDKAGNETVSNLNVYFDTTAPAAQHMIDDSSKDLTFRIGDAANEAGDSAALNTDVGGKYSNGTYGNALSMQIRGLFPDRGNGADGSHASGINKYYYLVFYNQEVVIDSTKATGAEPVEGVAGTSDAGKLFFNSLDVLKAYVIENKTGAFMPSAQTEQKRVYYNITPTAVPATSVNTNDRFGGTPKNAPNASGEYTVIQKNDVNYVQFYKNIDSNYKTTITGLEEGKNYLVIVAEDNAGNSSVDVATVGSETYPCYSLNVDVTAPTIPTKLTPTTYTNNDGSQIIIQGTVSDKSKTGNENGSSGIKEIVFTRDGGTGSVTLSSSVLYSAASAPTTDDLTAVPDDSTLRHWSKDISSLVSGMSSGTAIISAKVVDVAGFETSVPVATVMVDVDPPVVNITSPAVDAKVGNTTFTISGTANDGTGAGLSTRTADKMILYYTKSSALENVTQAPSSITPGTDIENSWVVLADNISINAIWSASPAIPDSVAPDGENTILYFTASVKDNAGSGNTGYAVPRKVTVDHRKPTFVNGTVGGLSSTSASQWFNDRTINIAGSFTDTYTNTSVTPNVVETGSGVNTVIYQIGDAAVVEIPTTDESFDKNIQIPADAENPVSLKIWAKDVAGNEIEATDTDDYKVYSINIDTTAPSSEINYFKKGSDSLSAPSGTVYIKTLGADGSTTVATTFTLYGICQDEATGSGIKALKLKKDGEDFTPTSLLYSTEAITGTDGSVPTDDTYGPYSEASPTSYKSWKAVFNVTASGRITVEGEDIAGNKRTSVSALDITVDNTPPEVSNVKLNVTTDTSAVTNEVYSATTTSAGTTTKTYYLNNTVSGKTFTVTGLATDNVGLQSAVLNIVNTASPAETTLTSTAANLNGSLSFSVGDWSGWTTGATATITLTDKAGNTATSEALNISFDTVAPLVDSTKLKTPTKIQTESSLFKFEGEAACVHPTETDSVFSGYDKVDIAFTNAPASGETPTAPSAAQTTANVAANGSWSSTVEFGNTDTFGNIFVASDGTAVEGTKYLWVRAYDNAGNVGDWGSKDFVYDTATPTIEFTDTVDNETTNITINPVEDSKRNHGFKLEVNVHDSYGVDKVEVKYGSTTVQAVKTGETTEHETWLKEFVVGSSNDSEDNYLEDEDYNFEIIVTDKSGKPAKKTKHIIVDTTPPTISSKAIADTFTPACTINSEGTDVNWYRQNQIPVNVTTGTDLSGIVSVQAATDTAFTNPVSLMLSGNSWTGSVTCTSQGANTIYIKATDGAGNSNEVNETNSITAFVDTLPPQSPAFLGMTASSVSIPASEITSVLVNKTSPITVYAAIVDDGTSSTWTGIRAEAPSPTAPGEKAFVQKKGKSGTSEPVAFTSLPPAISNGISAWQATHSYNAGDVVKNDSKVYISNSTHSSASTFTEDAAEWKQAVIWSYVVATTDMRSGGVNFTVKDNAGNEADYVLFQMTVDIDPPTVTLSAPTDADTSLTGRQINGVISLSGTASDNKELYEEVDDTSATMKLYYTTNETLGTATTEPAATAFETGTVTASSAASKWVEIASTQHSNTWSFSNINTAALDGTTAIADNTPVYFMASAKDRAGNTGYSYQLNAAKQRVAREPCIVDQDSDRPVILLTSPSDISDLATGSVKWESRTISGTVSDDDGVSYIGYYRGSSISYDSTAYTELTPNNGIWRIELSDDGTNNLFFKVTAGEKDYFANLSTTYNPAVIYDEAAHRGTYKLTDGSNKFGYRPATENTTQANALALIIDTTAPDVLAAEFTTDVNVTSGSENWNTGIASKTFGGTLKNNFKIRQSAWDINGVKTMTVKVVEIIDGVDSPTLRFNQTYNANTAVTLAENANHQSYLRFTSDTISTENWPSTGEAADGSVHAYRLEIIMSDGIKTTTTKPDLNVDNTPPTVSFTGPASQNIQSGGITVNGTSTESGKIYYTVSTYGEQTHKPSSMITAGQKLTSWTGYTVSADGTSITPKSPDGTITGTDGTGVSVPEYTLIPNTTNLTWNVSFDGDTTDTLHAHSSELKHYAQSLGLTNDLDNFTDLVNFYIWIKAEDSVGNTAEYSHLVKLDPQGDRPVVALSNPEEPDAVKGAATVGGTIKLYGTAEDSNGSVDGVWIQLLSAKNGGAANGYGAVTRSENNITAFAPTANDVTFWLTNNYPVYYIASNQEPVELKLASNTTNTTATVFNSSTHIPADCFIKANLNGASWNLKINKKHEFDLEQGAASANDMAIRVYARDNEKNMSYPVTRYFKVDRNSPQITDVVLKQYATTDTTFATPLASQEARQAMYVKGKWYLEFTVTDDDAIESIDFLDSNSHETTEMSNATIDDVTETGGGVKKQVRYALPTDTAGVGVFRRTIKASDSLHNGTYEVEINYDNEAPKLLKDSSEEFDIESSVRQNHGFYKLYSKVSDATNSTTGTPSGIKAVGFYFMRRESDTEGLIYDPVQRRADPISTNNLQYHDGLYWLNGSITCNEGGSITLGSGLSDKLAYIHAGSYIRLDGVMYKITSVSGTTITIDESHGNYTTAQIALAQFVDNRKSEYEASSTKNSTTGYYTDIRNDDGDGMVEELGGTRTVSSWQGAIVSRNIPDGPIEIHYTAYDESMNYALGVVGNTSKTTYDSYTTAEALDLKSKTLVSDGQYASYVYTHNSESPAYISNNAPRLAGVTVAIDYTGSGNYDTATKTSYYFQQDYIRIDNNGTMEKKPVAVTNNLEVSEKTKDSSGNVTAHKGVNTIKGKTWIVPEMVGGNGKLWYLYNVYGSSANGSKNTADQKKNSGTNATYFADGRDDYDQYEATLYGSTYIDSHSASKGGADESTRTPSYIIHDTSFFTGTGGTGDASVTQPLWFDYTIYDSTEASSTENSIAVSSLTNNQKATISIAMAVEVNDTVDPNVVFNDLYWKSASENSVYWENGKAKGHVELRSDLIDGADKIGGVYGMDDDKVSGIVKFTGYAWDNKCLSELKWAIVENDTAATNAYSSPVYKFGTGMQNGAIFDTTTGNWTSSATLADDYYTFEVSKLAADGAYHDQNGHKVRWTLTVDTSHITGVVAENLRVIVQATDTASRSSAITNTVTTSTANQQTDPATYDKETSRPTYKVDVVPYISEIVTSLTSLKRNNPSVYTRTARGHYTLKTGETITFEGFNLASQTSFPIDSSTSSGQFNGTVNGLRIINNINNNDAKGSYTGTVNLTTNPTGSKEVYDNYYNRKPNGDNNNLLTDDIYFDIWEIDSNAAVPFNNKGKIAQAIMKINPVTDQLGFAFASNSGYFSMAGKTIEAQAGGAANWNRPAKNSAFILNFNGLQDYSYAFWCAELMEFHSVGFTYDKLGHSYGVAAGGNVNAGNSTAVDFFDLFTDRWGKGLGDVSGNDDHGHHKASKSGYNAIRLEKTGIIYNGNTIDPDRFHTPSIVTATHSGSDDTSVYLAYYDAITGEIRFRAGNTANKENNNSFFRIGSISSNYYTLSSAGLDNNILSDGNRVNVYSSNNDSSYVAGPYIVQNYVQNSKLQLVDTNGTIISEDYSNHYLKLVPEQSKGNFGTFVDMIGTGSGKNSGIAANNYTNVAVIAGNSGRETCDYYSLGVVPGATASADKVFLIWYDENERALFYSYASDLSNTNLKNNQTAADWTTKVRVFDVNGAFETAGEYCKIAVDENGGVHIAALDPSTSDLVYAYLAADKVTNPATSDFKACVVDSNGIVGDSLTIDVAFDGAPSAGGKAIPRIGYYSSSTKRPKLAYLVKTDTVNPAGAVGDAFTGFWECTVVPSSYNLDFSDKNLINVGVFKDSNGVIKSSATTQSSQYENYLVSSESFYGSHWGIKYGNGTSNAVLGYVVKINSSLMHIETAQMR